MKNVYKNKVKINKKRKSSYPDEYKMKEINEKKKLKKMMDNYFNDYNKISKKLKITESPYILVSEKDYEDAVYNTDLMIRKWNDFYDMTPTYNPQVEDNYYNDSNIIFEKGGAGLIWQPENSAMFSFRRSVSPTVGIIAVSNGTVRVTEGAGLPRRPSRVIHCVL